MVHPDVPSYEDGIPISITYCSLGNMLWSIFYHIISCRLTVANVDAMNDDVCHMLYGTIYRHWQCEGWRPIHWFTWNCSWWVLSWDRWPFLSRRWSMGALSKSYHDIECRCMNQNSFNDCYIWNLHAIVHPQRPLNVGKEKWKWKTWIRDNFKIIMMHSETWNQMVEMVGK